MFDKLKSAFSNASKSFAEKELKEKDIEDILFELEIALLESDVAVEVADTIKDDLKSELIGTRVDKNTIETFIRNRLIRSVSTLIDDAGKVDLFANIDSFKEKNEPYIVLFVGINGTGKTTSLAKMAHLLQKSKYSIVVAAADTFRAGAIEQLKEHTKRLNLKIIAQNYGSDPAAVSRDAVLYAKSHKIDCVLIDTAGRMQTSKNLMEQIEKITKVVKPHLKIFVGDSLAGNDTVNQAKQFYEHTKFDGAILTKSDADARGGAVLSVVTLTKTPVMFVGVGQQYDDLRTFDKELFLKNVFGNIDDVDLTQTPETTQDTPETTQDTPETTQDTPETTQDTPETTQDTPETTQDTPETTQDTPETTQDTPETTQDTPETTQDISEPEKIESGKQQEKQQDKTFQTKSDDPFEGISDADIAKYADLYDIPTPESDEDAVKMANAIREWIKNEKPKPDGKSDNDDKNEKPKKKQGLFGFFKK